MQLRLRGAMFMDGVRADHRRMMPCEAGEDIWLCLDVEGADGAESPYDPALCAGAKGPDWITEHRTYPGCAAFDLRLAWGNELHSFRSWDDLLQQIEEWYQKEAEA